MMMARRVFPGLKTKRLLAGACAIVATAMVAAPAYADYCDQLRAQYRAAGSGGGGGASASQIRQLRNQVAALDSQARAKNCRGLGIFRKPAADCNSVVARLNRAQRDLASAQRGGSRRTSSSAERSRIYSQMRRNGCTAPDSGSEWAGSGYRTLCVRTCDGYYFPISFSAGRSRLKTDEMVCKSMYGGAGAELFYHYNGRGPEEAVSTSGRRLESEPFAFAYRKTFSDSCQAELKRGLSILGEAFADKVKPRPDQPGFVAAVKETRTPSMVPHPIARSEPGTDPETLANRAGGFEVKPVEPDTDGMLMASGMRLLGPNYYYEAPTEIAKLYEAPDFGPQFTLIGSARAEERTELVDPETTVR